MAAVFTEVAQASLLGGVKMLLGTIAMDASYPTNGEALDLSAYFNVGVYFGLGLNPAAAVGYLLVHNGGTVAAGTIMAFWADYDAVADGPLVEAANTTNLAAITACPMLFIGN